MNSHIQVSAVDDLLDALREMVQTYQARATIAKATGEAAVLSHTPSRCTITLTREELVERILKSWEMEKGRISPLTRWLAEDAANTILTTEGAIPCK